MAIPHAKAGEVIDVRPLGPALTNSRTTTLAKTDSLEIIRLVIPQGKDIAEHRVAGEITVQCLVGHVIFNSVVNRETSWRGNCCSWKATSRIRCTRSSILRCL
jgi:quercetin dioxygenase-like cupin family protein